MLRSCAVHASAAAAAAAAAGFLYNHRAAADAGPAATSAYASSQKSFTAAQVAEHCLVDDLWVSIDGNVHDLSGFAAKHPGGVDRLMMAAGGDASYFVAYWGVHTQSAAFGDTLKDTFIGVLSTSTGAGASVADHVQELYHSETQPKRDPQLLRPPSNNMRRVPFTGEPRGLFPHTQNTPNDSFYVRNHAPVPTGLPRSVRLLLDNEGCGDVADNDDRDGIGDDVDTELGLDAMEAKYGTTALSAAIQCAGNRLDERGRLGDCMFDPSRMGGKGWLGNAVWEGVLLSDVLRENLPLATVAAAAAAAASGDEDEDEDGWHVVFTGADGYETSVPLKFVFGAPFLLATKMNGELLPEDHGAPVRLLAPGFIGARNVKWISQIRVCKTPSQSPWQRRFYTEDESSKPLMWWPVQSIITSHNHDSECSVSDLSKGDSVLVTGLGYSGKGRVVRRVEVSGDRGDSWQDATLTGEQESPYSFRLWQTHLPLSRVNVQQQQSRQYIELWCRATDSSSETQPLDPTTPGPFRESGYLFNPVQKIKINLLSQGSSSDEVATT